MRYFVFLSLMAFAVCLSGCWQAASTEPTGTVSGQLTNKGKKLSADTKVVFMNSSGVAAFGATVEDGSYQIDSYNDGNIPIGMYRVMIQPPASALGAEEEPSAEEMLDNPELSRPKKTAVEFPFKYRQLGTSGLQFEVKEGPNQIDIDLK